MDPPLRVREDWWVFEDLLRLREDWWVFEKKTYNPLAFTQKTLIFAQN